MQCTAQTSIGSELPSSTPAPTSSTTVLSTVTLIGPTNSPVPTLYRDCPSSNNTLYSVTYGSTSYDFRKICNASYANQDGTAYSVTGVYSSLDECIIQCATYDRNNATAIAAGTASGCNAVCWRNTFDERND